MDARYAAYHTQAAREGKKKTIPAKRLWRDGLWAAGIVSSAPYSHAGAAQPPAHGSALPTVSVTVLTRCGSTNASP